MTNKNVSLQLRLKLFVACCTPVAIFGLSVIALTRKDLDEVNVLQRKIMRKVVGWRRCDGEPWENTMRRMKHRLEAGLKLYHVDKWANRVLRGQWRYAGKVACSPEQAPWRMLTTWIPEGGHRRVGRPRQRWDDFFTRVFQSSC